MPTRKYKYKVTTLSDKSFAAGGAYRCYYIKDTNVYAPEGTLGLMVFKRRKDAVAFIKSETNNFDSFKIKKVIPIGRGSVPKYICALLNLNEFYDPCYISSLIQQPPKGTICYAGVFVCD